MSVRPTFKMKTWLDVPEVVKAIDQAAVRDPLKRAARIVEREAKRSMRTGGVAAEAIEGEKAAGAYWYGEPLMRWVTASPVGQPPHSQTRNLVNSISIAKTERGTYLVGPTTSAFYGRTHEFGLLGFKRPFMRPALAKTQRKFPYLFRNLPLAETRAGRRLNASRRPFK